MEERRHHGLGKDSVRRWVGFELDLESGEGEVAVQAGGLARVGGVHIVGMGGGSEESSRKETGHGTGLVKL